jgi:hypothetical protein
MRTMRSQTSTGPHRFSGSWVWNLPGQGLLGGFRFSGFVQMQSGLPYSIYSVEPELGNASRYGDLVRGSGGLYRLGFGRPSLCGSLDDLRQHGDDPTEAAFNSSVLCSPTSAAGGYPNNQGFGNLGRNVLRGFWQRRVDLSLAKAFSLGGARNFEVRWDVFNVFNTVTYALPENVIGCASTILARSRTPLAVRESCSSAPSSGSKDRGDKGSWPAAAGQLLCPVSELSQQVVRLFRSESAC